ncbi:glycosyltransferase [Actinomadura atramentaria]|uniref:glycosyltransferase n=1 Tax=Actinomadura atramentaria TaxID=1990 RepID=UPI00037D3364|nr:glycosyltransferase [Actinomadura atramentaria]
MTDEMTAPATPPPGAGRRRAPRPAPLAAPVPGPVPGRGLGPVPAAYYPGVSVIVAARDAEDRIAAAVRAAADAEYPGPLEVIVVDDGSRDRTARVVEALALPRVWVVRGRRGGRASALNTGVAVARHDLLVFADADAVLARDAVRRLVAALTDPGVGAVGGAVLRGPERDRAGTRGRAPGSVGAVRRLALSDAGGVPDSAAGGTGRGTGRNTGRGTGRYGGDAALRAAIRRAGWRVVRRDDAVAWKDAPRRKRLRRLLRRRR